jgi:hypothetical protein
MSYVMVVCVQVPHFSKYGIADEDDDDEIELTEQEKKKLKTMEEKQRAVQVIMIKIIDYIKILFLPAQFSTRWFKTLTI